MLQRDVRRGRPGVLTFETGKGYAFGHSFLLILKLA